MRVNRRGGECLPHPENVTTQSVGAVADRLPGGRTVRWAILAFLLATSLLACLPPFPSEGTGDGGGDQDVTTTDGALRSDAPIHIVDGGDAGGPGKESDADAAATPDQSVGPDEDADAELAPDQSAGPDSATAIPDAGVDAPVCINVCTAGATECGTGEVETCTVQANGCTLWEPTTQCGANRLCSVTAGVASCACVGTICSEAGATCQSGGTTVATCAKDANGCLYVASTKTCASPMVCAGTAPSAACSLTCSNTCTAGQKSCVSGELATCTLGSNGCLSYAPAVACPSVNESCTGTAGSASCACLVDPVCHTAGSTCADNNTMTATCAADAQGCIYNSGSKTCTNGACSNGACCTNTCTPGQKTCASTEIETCTLGSNGCYSYGSAGACPTHETCTGAAGSGLCTCVANTCTSAAAICVPGTSTLADCVQDPATRCFYESGTPTTCNSGCSDGACCPLVCTSGTTQCLTSTSTQSQTCAVSSSGCITWAAAQNCSGDYVCERHGTAACVDPSWAEWPMPNSEPDVVNGAPGSSLENYSKSTDGSTATDGVTGLVWQLGVGGPLSNQSDAEGYCRTLTLPAGSQTTDWRLPSIIELESLVDMSALAAGGTTSTAVPPFGGIAANGYWSSTAVAPSSAGSGWVLDFSSGSGESEPVGAVLNVLCVR
jgi:hypothetical protein